MDPELYLPASEINKIIQNVRRTLLRWGFDTREIEVVADTKYLWSYCTEYDNGQYSIILGRHALFNKPDNQELLRQTLFHEFGHAWLFINWSKFETKDKRRWRRRFGKYSLSTGEPAPLMSLESDDFDHTKYTTWYAMVDPHEDFAETYMTLMIEYTVAEKSLLRKKMDLIEYLIEKYSA